MAVRLAIREDDATPRSSATDMPTARKVAKASSHTLTGSFAKRDHTIVPFESGMELEYCEILDADRRVRDFRTQAPPLQYDAGGRVRRHFFDFESELVDDSAVFSAVKPKARQTSSAIHGIVGRIEAIHGRPDRRFVVVDEDHLADHQIRNARLTNRALREDPAETVAIDRSVLAYVQSCSVPPQVVDVQIALDLHGRTLTSVARLLRSGDLQLMDSTELTIASIVMAVGYDAQQGAVAMSETDLVQVSV